MIEVYDDVLGIKEIWKKFQKEFGRLYPSYVEEQVAAGRFFCYRVNGIVAGIADYVIKNRNREVTINVIGVLPEYQGLGISKKLIHHVYKETESLFKNLGYVFKIEAYEGLPNNSFWEYMSTHHELHVSPSGKTRSIYYYLDLERLDRM